jgi:hypothetical protein
MFSDYSDMDSELPFYGFDEVEFESNRDVLIEIKMIYYEQEIDRFKSI